MGLANKYITIICNKYVILNKAKTDYIQFNKYY